MGGVQGYTLRKDFDVGCATGQCINKDPTRASAFNCSKSCNDKAECKAFVHYPAEDKCWLLTGSDKANNSIGSNLFIKSSPTPPSSAPTPAPSTVVTTPSSVAPVTPKTTVAPPSAPAAPFTPKPSDEDATVVITPKSDKPKEGMSTTMIVILVLLLLTILGGAGYYFSAKKEE
jgi:cobalamin biosynthesis Mg chelatase CobN